MDKRIERLSNTEAVVYALLVYASKKQISRGYITKCLGITDEDYVSEMLANIEKEGLIVRNNRYENAYKDGKIKTMLGYTLIYKNWFMVDSELITADIDYRVKGFALKLRTLAFDDSCKIGYNKKQIASKLGISRPTLDKYVKMMVLGGLLDADMCFGKWFIQREICHLSDDRKEIVYQAVSNSFLYPERDLRQMVYFVNRKLYSHPDANKIFDKMVAGLWNKRASKKEIDISEIGKAFTICDQSIAC